MHRFFIFALATLVGAGCALTKPRSSDASRNIAAVFVDVAQLHHDVQSDGDTWDYLWADDDNLYSFGCDGRGYGTANHNVNFNRLTGPAWNELSGSPVNPMGEYGGNGAYLADHSAQLKSRDWSKVPIGPNWKVSGADSIDGVFYAFIANNWYGNQNAYGGNRRDPFLRQTVNNQSLIKSTDHGRTWSRAMAANALQPMWTNRLFSTGFFFKYGQDGGATTQDAQDKYVYAMSNDGYWNSGSSFRLGRVLRAQIGGLNAGDWEYFCAGRWTKDLSAATVIPGLPNGKNQCTMGSPVWLPTLQKYVAPVWYDTGDYHEWYFPQDVIFAFYQADHPWGPWSYIGEKSAMEFIGAQGRNRSHRWYGPTFSPKFITAHPDGSVTAILLFSGSTWEDKPDSLYKNNSCPVTFYPQSLPPLRATFNDTAASYSDGWFYQTNRNVGDLNNDVHVSTNAANYCDFTFTGEGIEVLLEKFHDLGDVEVLLDGVSQGISHLYQDPMPRLYRVPVFRKMDLPPGSHTIRIINRDTKGAFCLVDGFRVYGRN